MGLYPTSGHPVAAVWMAASGTGAVCVRYSTGRSISHRSVLVATGDSVREDLGFQKQEAGALVVIVVRCIATRTAGTVYE